MATGGRFEHHDLTRVPVAYLILGWENNKRAIINFLRSATSGINLVTDPITPTIGMKQDWLNTEITEARERGVRFRQISDITPENLPDLKKRMAEIDELRHLSGIRVFFGFSDFEAIALVPSLLPNQDIEKMQFIQSDSESVLRYKQLIFDTLWDRAIPAQSRFNELEGKPVDGNSGVGSSTQVIDRIYACRDCKDSFMFALIRRLHLDERQLLIMNSRSPVSTASFLQQ